VENLFSHHPKGIALIVFQNKVLRIIFGTEDMNNRRLEITA
jgi:hypothetical protein